MLRVAVDVYPVVSRAGNDDTVIRNGGSRILGAKGVECDVGTHGTWLLEQTRRTASAVGANQCIDTARQGSIHHAVFLRISDLCRPHRDAFAQLGVSGSRKVGRWLPVPLTREDLVDRGRSGIDLKLTEHWRSPHNEAERHFGPDVGHCNKLKATEDMLIGERCGVASKLNHAVVGLEEGDAVMGCGEQEVVGSSAVLEGLLNGRAVVELGKTYNPGTDEAIVVWGAQVRTIAVASAHADGVVRCGCRQGGIGSVRAHMNGCVVGGIEVAASCRCVERI